MLEYFSRALAEDDKLREDLGYTWYLIKSIDIDGTKLNEKWFKGPITLSNYARNYFRPAGYEQVEWTFPFKYKKANFDKPIPETVALMKIIDEIKPDFMSYEWNGLPNRFLSRKKLPIVTWTIRSEKQEKEVLKYASTVVFENYIPDSPYNY